MIRVCDGYFRIGVGRCQYGGCVPWLGTGPSISILGQQCNFCKLALKSNEDEMVEVANIPLDEVIPKNTISYI